MKIKRLTVEIDKELHSAAKLKAYSKGLTLKEVIVNLLKKWLRIKQGSKESDGKGN